MTRRGRNGGRTSLGKTLGRRRGATGSFGAPKPNGDGLDLVPVIGLASDHPCVDCAQCCKYVAIEIDAPTTMTEYDYMIWYLVHPGISVFVDWEGRWFVKFETRCSNLQQNGMCGVYETRPAICRDFDWTQCERHLVDEPADKWLFRSADEFRTWLERQRPKAYQKLLAFEAKHRRAKTPKELRRLKVTALLPPPA